MRVILLGCTVLGDTYSISAIVGHDARYMYYLGAIMGHDV